VREAGPGEGGEARYRLLEPVRQYAAALLAGTPDQSRTRDRHLEWAAALAARAEPALVSHERRAALRLLRQQLDDVRAAVRWAGEAPLDAGSEARGRGALQITGALTYFWVSAGAWEDGWQAVRAGAAGGAPRGRRHAARGGGRGAAARRGRRERSAVGGGCDGPADRTLDRAAELAGAAQAMLAAHHERRRRSRRSAARRRAGSPSRT
jgi:hypothetical protein